MELFGPALDQVDWESEVGKIDFMFLLLYARLIMFRIGRALLVGFVKNRVLYGTVSSCVVLAIHGLIA